MAIGALFADMWSVTGFSDPKLDDYAESRIRADTRRGVQIMALLSIAAQIGVALVLLNQESATNFLSTNILVGALSLHIFVSAAYVDDVRALHMLGMVFLIVGALAVTVLAHRTGDLSIGMMAAIVMLFIAIPLVPWALREATAVIVLTYILLTISLISVPGRFDTQSLIVLQLLVIGSAMVVIVLTARNTLVRKHDIRTRFQLENAHQQMKLLSMKDHLTGAWNRRYLEEKFPKMLRACQRDAKKLHMAVLDVNNFKSINDNFGHHMGDEILISLAVVFVRHLGDDGCLIRLGGDEFQILYSGDDLDGLIDRAMAEVQSGDSAACLIGRQTITLSAGIVSADPTQTVELDELYKAADRALYSVKNSQRPNMADKSVGNLLARTGTWQL